VNGLTQRMIPKGMPSRGRDNDSNRSHPALPDREWQSGLGQACRGSGRAAALIGAALLLLGCSFGTGSNDPAATSSGNRLTNLFSSSPANPAGNPDFNPFDCPPIEIRTGAGTLTVGNTPQTSATDVRYQLSFGQLARQCSAVGSNLTIKVGVQGRVILGPAGAPGTIDVPLRYAIVSEGAEPRTVLTKFKRLAVNVPPDQSNIPFSDIDDGLSVPIPPPSELATYVVYVGFDSMGDAAEKKPAPKKPAPKRK
jgi:hypothetical protein